MLDAEDEVRLYEDGWKDRYFRSKFDVSAGDHEFRRKVKKLNLGTIQSIPSNSRYA